MKKNFACAIGGRLKALRGVVSQALTAKSFGIAQQTYAGWENDKSRPDITELRGIAEFYGVSADYLLGLTDDPTPASKRTATGAVTVNGHGNAIANGNGNKLHEPTNSEQLRSLDERVSSLERMMLKLVGENGG